jgi:hypothetical protein
LPLIEPHDNWFVLITPWRTSMRKPRDYDAELKTLGERARKLQQRKVQQLGELVVATGADALSVEELAGALIAAVAVSDRPTKEDWRAKGAVFFLQSRRAAGGDPSRQDSSPAVLGNAASSASETGA